MERGGFHFPHRLSDQRVIYPSLERQHAFHAGKVIYSGLLADLFPRQ
jgi:hypothetical protein